MAQFGQIAQDLTLHDFPHIIIQARSFIIQIPRYVCIYHLRVNSARYFTNNYTKFLIKSKESAIKDEILLRVKESPFGFTSI